MMDWLLLIASDYRVAIVTARWCSVVEYHSVIVGTRTWVGIKANAMMGWLLLIVSAYRIVIAHTIKKRDGIGCAQKNRSVVGEPQTGGASI
ncbi:MAG: hypothetical protein ACF8OB_13080 [Phycisphaeraceae bacterium JB051]